MVRAYVRRAPVTIPSGTSTGAPIRVVIDYDGGEIRAYRMSPVKLRTYTSPDSAGPHDEALETLERHLTEEPVMKIRRMYGEDDYEVDFDAGFQRGRIVVGKDELCKKSQWPTKNGQPYLKWIGLKCTDPAVKEWFE